jgi:hypothetical protein
MAPMIDPLFRSSALSPLDEMAIRSPSPSAAMVPVLVRTLLPPASIETAMAVAVTAISGGRDQAGVVDAGVAVLGDDVDTGSAGLGAGCHGANVTSVHDSGIALETVDDGTSRMGLRSHRCGRACSRYW